MVELSLNYNGFPVIVADTAGLRATKDEVEAIGIERALMRFVPSYVFGSISDLLFHRADTADIKLCVLSLPQVFPDPSSLQVHIDFLTSSLIDPNTIILLNKVDSFPLTTEHTTALSDTLREDGKDWLGASGSRPFWAISVKSEAGLKELSSGITEVLKKR